MNLENFEEIGYDLQKERLKEFGLENATVIEFDQEKEKVTEQLREQIRICHGTGEEIKNGKGGVIYDCKKHSLENETAIKVDERLVRFITNEFSKRPDISGIIITSGWRCPKHNEFSVADDKSGMTMPNSLHRDAQAVDFILLDKTGKPLEYQEYNDLINEMKKKKPKHDRKLKYSFYDLASWKNIARNIERNLHLTEWIQSLFFAKAYRPEEGRDTDNKHKLAYMHLDFRGIDPNKKPADKYYRRAGLI